MDKDQHISVLWRHLMDMNRQIKQTIALMSCDANISCSSISLIFQLEHKTQMKMNDIADHLGITLGAATSLIDKLEAQGWVTRVRSTTDRRIIYVELTEEGKRKLLSMREQYAKQATQIFETISVDKLQEMSTQLKEIERYLSDYNQLADKRKPS
ncbi:MarR family winged helix-turn-helix transcriptional regulator [Paenibacillus hamazuiensis]|uniref:MarR family winged helix-turn-helix transcriptional regulator n=1 Tax=Paenibacillus hamazuiensis TaxID=2936508 RepID=UPI00200D90BD|nr:MarR family transcriptional regulator [Paenibacillus hamazuiensis]